MGQREEEDQTVAACNIGARAASRYARRVFWADPDDLEQNAIVATLEACRTFDPAVGVPFTAYATRAAMLACRRYCLKNTSPVSAPYGGGDGMRAREQELRTHRRVELEEAHEDPTAWADALLVDADWQVRVHEQLDFVLQARQGDEATVSLRILLDDEKPGVVAASLGVEVSRVYRLAQRAREALGRNALLFAMLKEIDE